MATLLIQTNVPNRMALYEKIQSQYEKDPESFGLLSGDIPLLLEKIGTCSPTLSIKPIGEALVL